MPCPLFPFGGERLLQVVSSVFFKMANSSASVARLKGHEIHSHGIH